MWAFGVVMYFMLNREFPFSNWFINKELLEFNDDNLQHNYN